MLGSAHRGSEYEGGRLGLCLSCIRNVSTFSTPTRTPSKSFKTIATCCGDLSSSPRGTFEEKSQEKAHLSTSNSETQRSFPNGFEAPRGGYGCSLRASL